MVTRHDKPGTSSAAIPERVERPLNAAGSGAQQAFRNAVDRYALEQAMPGAAAHGELFLLYQPILHLATGRAVECEALLRWRHPSQGVLMPGAFIPVAERAGHIHALGAWVLDAVCRQLASWRDAGNGPRRVAMNASVLELEAGGYARRVADRLAAFGLPPDALSIEVTESVASRHPCVVHAELAALAEAGVHLAVDDFGAGFASLHALRHIPANRLKLDKALVCDVESSRTVQVVVSATVGMGHDLGMAVLAEGIESDAQLRRLLSLGCDDGQGYYIGRPVGHAAVARADRTMDLLQLEAAAAGG